MTDKQIKWAITTNKDGYSFAVYRSGSKTVYGYFSLPWGAGETLDARLPMYRVDKLEARDLEVAKSLADGLTKHGVEVYHRAPESLAFLLSYGSGTPTEGCVRDIMDGRTVLFRYYMVGGGSRETSFDLSGARAVIAEAIGVSADRLEDIKAKAEAAQLATDRARREVFEAAKQAQQDAMEAEKRRVEEAKRRTWTSGGYKVEAEFITVIGGKVRLKRIDNGQEIDVPLGVLAAEDQEFIRERKWLDGLPSNGAQPLGRFIGRWRIINDEGVIGAYFSLTASQEAKKDHAPDAKGVWEIVGDDARITWSDGWRDVFRAQGDQTLVLAYKPGTSWDDTPVHTHRAVREQ